jgi:hypothetical protein
MDYTVRLDVDVPSDVIALDPTVSTAHADFLPDSDRLHAALDALHEVDDLEADDRAKMAEAVRAGKPVPRVAPAGYFEAMRAERHRATRVQHATAKTAAAEYMRAVSGSPIVRDALLAQLDALQPSAAAAIEAARVEQARLRRVGTLLRGLAHQAAYLSAPSPAAGHRKGLDVGLIFNHVHKNDPAPASRGPVANAWETLIASARSHPSADDYQAALAESAPSPRREAGAILQHLASLPHGASVVPHADKLLRGETVVLLPAQRNAYLRAVALAKAEG